MLGRILLKYRKDRDEEGRTEVRSFFVRLRITYILSLIVTPFPQWNLMKIMNLHNEVIFFNGMKGSKISICSRPYISTRRQCFSPHIFPVATFYIVQESIKVIQPINVIEYSIKSYIASYILTIYVYIWWVLRLRSHIVFLNKQKIANPLNYSNILHIISITKNISNQNLDENLLFSNLKGSKCARKHKKYIKNIRLRIL